MFESWEVLHKKLQGTGYFITPEMTKVVWLAGEMRRPLLLEGPAGSGKTHLAIAVQQVADTHIERLQCYEGLTYKQAIGEFDEGLQRLYMEHSKGQGLGWSQTVSSLKGRDFFRSGPLMRALESPKPCVLLIDELDKVDHAFEALLLEILSAWQLSIWYMLSFEAMDSCFTLELFKEVSKEYRLHEYMIQPGLLLNLLDPDQRPAKAPEEPTEVVVPISVAA
jgi:MoxR-like ATPase